MRTRRSRACFAVISAMLIFLSGTASAGGLTMFMKQLTETMAKVKRGETLMVQRDAAEHLAELTRKIDPKKVNDKALADLVSLLDMPDEPTRFWVAASLGNLGPRARIAIPRLRKILKEVDCLPGAVTSADAIRHALTRIGVRPPPSNCERLGR